MAKSAVRDWSERSSRCDHSLCCVSDILARQSGCTVDGKDDAVSCREVLRERTGAQARMAGDVDEVEWRVQLGRVALRGGGFSR